MVKMNRNLRVLTSKVTTPICGARLDTLKCESYDVTRCSWMCIKEVDKDVDELDLFEREDLAESDLEDMYVSEKTRKELTTNMDREEDNG